MNADTLTIPGAFFRSGYAVYVVEIAHQSTEKNTITWGRLAMAITSWPALPSTG